MNNELKEILTDIKAAVRLGHIEALQYALDGLLDIPEVAANSTITTSFIQQALLPIARVLAQPPVPTDQLSPLGDSDYAACRAVFGAFCAYRYFSGQDVLELIQKAAKDPRQEVRAVTSMALLDAGSQDIEKLSTLAEKWLQGQNPRLKAVGLGLLSQSPEEALAQLSGFDAGDNPEILSAMADLIGAIAQGEYIPRVFSLLLQWSADADRYSWVICKALSSHWAASSPETVINILSELEAKGGKKKQITSALKALARHDDSGQILAELNTRLIKVEPDEKDTIEN